MTNKIMLIWSAKNKLGKENLAYGISTQTWGFKHPPLDTVTESPVEYVLFGSNFSRGNVRSSVENWQSATCDLVIAEATTPFFVGTAPHWPDEIDANTVIYPHRFGFTPLGRVTGIPLGGGGLLPWLVGRTMRDAAITSTALPANIDMAPALSVIGAEIDTATGMVNLNSTSGVAPPSQPLRGRPGRAGRSTDHALNDAVEKHSVALAVKHMHSHGYPEVEELGKPFDLVCRRTGREKHVEVKGTTGAGAEVEYTVNEVEHFRECPHGADLIVVRDITVNRTTDPYTASGGELLHVENYEAPREDLQATKWLGRVSGWELP